MCAPPVHWEVWCQNLSLCDTQGTCLLSETCFAHHIIDSSFIIVVYCSSPSTHTKKFYSARSIKMYALKRSWLSNRFVFLAQPTLGPLSFFFLAFSDNPSTSFYPLHILPPPQQKAIACSKSAGAWHCQINSFSRRSPACPETNLSNIRGGGQLPRLILQDRTNTCWHWKWSGC